MASHVIIIPEHPEDGESHRAAEKIRENRPGLCVVRCTSPAELFPKLCDLIMETEQKIDVLDFFGHGAPGQQLIGDTLLFSYGQNSHSLASALRLLLTDDAHVRLLGCLTAEGKKGQELLIELQEAFGGGVVVFGTLKRIIVQRDVDSMGLIDTREDGWLFSSSEARANKVGDADRRAEEQAQWFECVRVVRESHTLPQP